MRLADDARKCVVYLGYPSVGNEPEITPIGTGFLVSANDPARTYLVTARHVAEEFGDEPFAIRLNQKKGVGRNDYFDGAEWNFHPTDENVDVAVLKYDPPSWADWLTFPRRAFLDANKLKSKNTGAGDLAYVVGVFNLLHGQTRNLPFVHSGNIALMLEGEKIPVADWRDPAREQTIETEGYLVEATTLPGSSGSPVFVRRSIQKKPGELDKVGTWVYGSVWLLGLWQGSWMGDPSDVLLLPREDITVPLGVGVTIPATQIIEVLEQDKLKIAEKQSASSEIGIAP